MFNVLILCSFLATVSVQAVVEGPESEAALTARLDRATQEHKADQEKQRTEAARRKQEAARKEQEAVDLKERTDKKQEELEIKNAWRLSADEADRNGTPPPNMEAVRFEYYRKKEEQRLQSQSKAPASKGGVPRKSAATVKTQNEGPVKTKSDKIIEVSNKFSSADGNKKLSAAKEFLDLASENKGLTKQSIVDAYAKQFKSLTSEHLYESLEDSQKNKLSIQDSVIPRLDAARDFLIKDLEAKNAATGVQASDFVSTKPKPVEAPVVDNKTSDMKSKSVEVAKPVETPEKSDVDAKPGDTKPGEKKGGLKEQFNRWWSSWSVFGKAHVEKYVNTVFTQVLDGAENADIFKDAKVKADLAKIINEGKTKEEKQKIIQTMKNEIDKVSKKRINRESNIQNMTDDHFKESNEGIEIARIGYQLKRSLDQELQKASW